MVSYIFFKKLAKTNDFLEQPTVVSSAFDELQNEQHVFKAFQVDKFKKLNNPNDWFSEDFAELNLLAFQNTSFSQFTVLDAETVPQINVSCLFLRNFFRINYQLDWNTFIESSI